MSHEPAAIHVREADLPRLATSRDIVQAPARGAVRASIMWLLAHESATLGGVLLAIYLTLYGSLLASSNGLPFILDNNESFSTVWHAQNMATQDVSRSFWLTDESYGSNSEAHPFVHSHQGNFPPAAKKQPHATIPAQTGSAATAIAT